MRGYGIIFIVIILFQLPLSAQIDFDLLSLRYEQLAPSKPKDHATGTLTEDSKIQVSSLSLKAGLPLILYPDRAYFLVEPDLKVFFINSTNIPAGSKYFAPEQLYAIGLRTTLLYLFDNGWLLAVMAKPSLASDLDNIDGDHFTFEYGAMFNYEVTNELQTGLGIGYITNFGRPQFAPVVRLWWEISDQTSLDLFFPSHITLKHNLSERWQFDFSVSTTGKKFRLNKEESYAGNTFQYSAIQFGPRLKYYLSKGLSVFLQSGWATRRIFEAYYEDSSIISDLELQSDFFLKTGIALGLE